MALELNKPEAWESLSKCKDLSAAEADRIFFLERGQNPTEAKEFCKTCPVMYDCLKRALSNNEWGVWAGTTEMDRKQMRKHAGIVVTSSLFIQKVTPPHKTKPAVLVHVTNSVLSIGLFDLDGPNEADLV